MTLPIKSRHGLTRCTVCRTHIRAEARPSETDCPFCGANLLLGRSLVSGGGQASRATTRGGVLAASLLAFSLTACGGGDEPADPAPQTQSDTSGGDATGSEPGGDNPDGNDQYAEDPAEEPNAIAEYGVSPDDYHEEPAEEMRPVARYGMAPMR